MTTPFQLVWSDVSNNILTQSGFPIGFPGTSSQPLQLQLATNAVALGTFEILTNVAFYLTGDSEDVNIVQSIWTTLGDINHPERNGGLDISFDFGSTYIRFDQEHGMESDPTTWIILPAESVGAQGSDGILGAFDTAHFLVRMIIPSGATQFEKLNLKLSLGFDII
jgi:hypothetical protein